MSSKTRGISKSSSCFSQLDVQQELDRADNNVIKFSYNGKCSMYCRRKVRPALDAQGKLCDLRGWNKSGLRHWQISSAKLSIYLWMAFVTRSEIEPTFYETTEGYAHIISRAASATNDRLTKQLYRLASHRSRLNAVPPARLVLEYLCPYDSHSQCVDLHNNTDMPGCEPCVDKQRQEVASLALCLRFEKTIGIM